MDNMEIYEAVKAVPVEAQKQIGAGRLKGMTDINPMWRIQKLTQMFGPVGFGWKYEIIDKHIEEGGDGTKCAFVDINLYVKVKEQWSEPIFGTGGSSFVANERNGKYTSDECFKMALTDAISVSCKALGMGADVYWAGGRTKYSQTPSEKDIPRITDKQKAIVNEMIKSAATATNTSNRAVTQDIERELNIKLANANAEHYAKICRMLDQLIRPNGGNNGTQNGAS